MEFKLPDNELVIELHELALSMSPGTPGVLKPEVIDSAIHRPKTFIAYAEDYDIHLICAIPLESLARGHAFTDGDKRTAFLTCLLTYKLNGINLDITWATNKEAEEIALWVVEEKPDTQSIRKRLQNFTEKFHQSLIKSLIEKITENS